jgi:hypothetical protein
VFSNTLATAIDVCDEQGSVVDNLQGVFLSMRMRVI